MHKHTYLHIHMQKHTDINTLKHTHISLTNFFLVFRNTESLYSKNILLYYVGQSES